MDIIAITVVQWVLFLILTIYYYYRTVSFTFTSTWRFLLALILVNLGTMIVIIGSLMEHRADALIVIAEAMMVVAFIFIFDYHDRYKLTEPKGILKFVMFFLLGYILGRLLIPLIYQSQIVFFENDRNLLFMTNIFASIAFIRSIIYLNFENIAVQKLLQEKQISYLRTFSALYFVLIIISSFYFYVNFDVIETSPLLGFISAMLTLGVLTVSYTKTPLRNLVFPINLVWFGIADENGKIIYSYQIEHSTIHSFRYEDLITKFEKSYGSINSLISEALSVDLQIESFNGSQFSFVQQSIAGGTMLGIIDESNMSLVTYDYPSLFQKLQESPFGSVGDNTLSKEDLDQFLTTSLREGM